MDYDIPKHFIKPAYIREAPVIAPQDNNCLVQTGPTGSDTGDFGGFISISLSGTASNASLSTVPSYNISFTPAEGPIPSIEIQKQHFNYISKLVINPTEK